MSDILDRARAHYAALPRRDIKIPEWGEPGKPAVITWSALTVRDQERIYAADDHGRAPTSGTVRLRTMIYKSCDAAGRPLFDGMDEHSLRHEVDGNIVGRIAEAILFGAGILDKDGRAKSTTDQIDDAKNA